MYLHEDLWIKISNDFHAEINPILKEIDNDVINQYWFERKSIRGKFFILNDLLLSLNGNDITQSALVTLKNILEAYKIRVAGYYNSHILATCLIYISPENIQKRNKYFQQFKDYFDYSIYSLTAINECIMFPVDFIGFPDDCSFKLTAKLKNEKIKVERRDNPLFEIETKQKHKMGNLKRIRSEQHEIESIIHKGKRELWKKGEKYAFERFKDFSIKTLDGNKEILENFDRSILICNMLITKLQNNKTHIILPEIKNIHSTLLAGNFISVSFNEFQQIFHPEYSGPKIKWIGKGWELKYFIDRIDEKFVNTKKINIWADERFDYDVENLVKYLSKQNNLSLQKITKRHLLYKMFRE
ncbi:MAG: hypothetical protein JW833_05990 [Prolixibacteraceae bacterium]|nr:hypothetical protein [Prolixibacteraceae bacterium]